MRNSMIPEYVGFGNSRQSISATSWVLHLLSFLLAGICTYAFSPSLLPPSRILHTSLNTPRYVFEPSADDFSDTRSFGDLGLTSDLVRVTEKMGWNNPTAVQQLSIPSILEMGSSDLGKLGSNDNTSFGKRPDNIQLDQGYVSTLILCPTRELAAQTASVIQRLVSHLPKKIKSSISVEVVHGGVPIEPQVSALAKRRQTGTLLDFLVATPGRLVDVLKQNDNDPTMDALERRIVNAFEEKGQKKAERSRGKGRRGRSPIASSLTLNDIQELDLDRVDDDGRGSLSELLRQLDFLVFDEADRLLGGAFLQEIEELMSLLPLKAQSDMKVCLFSATFPEEVERRVDTVLAKLSCGSPLGSVARDSAPNIKHRAIKLNEKDRTQALRHLIEQHKDEWDRVLVFVGTRYTSEHVTRKLRRYGINAAELHGKLDQEARERRLKSFRSGNTQVLLSTDLAARGIDVDGLPVVINYDLPRGAADFTHRNGRTGRAGKEGIAITFITASKSSHFDFIQKKELGGKVIKREVLPDFIPDEVEWSVASMAEQTSIPGVVHSEKGLAHDRMFGGVKGRRKSKKDKLRKAAVSKSQE
ncbi:hypothetical protein HJC23_004575 [Cyclotella cryptica]|uniref:Uncharacterized protein n=1 Tax=Cyclotella cryptica TaxID=29204 RepID=A0ABD3QAE2_9STRA